MRLAHYEVLTFTDPGGNGINRGKAIGVFDATPDEVFRVARDYERYAEYAPRVRSAKVVERQGDGARRGAAHHRPAVAGVAARGCTRSSSTSASGATPTASASGRSAAR